MVDCIIRQYPHRVQTTICCVRTLGFCSGLLDSGHGYEMQWVSKGMKTT